MSTDTFSIFVTTIVVALAVTLGVGLPLLGLHLELLSRNSRRHEAELRRLHDELAERDATIEAYRQLTRAIPELATSTPTPRERWSQVRGGPEVENSA